jgi:IS30 family transposase
MRFFTARASGATLKQAVAAAGVSKTTGHYWLQQSGGVRPRQPRPRSSLRLSADEREAISRGLAARRTMTSIAAELGRSVSTVSREVARNSGPNGYRAARADRLARVRQARPRPGKLAGHQELRRYVEGKLAMRWSPEQIAHRLVVDFPDDRSMRVSHETIYTSLFVQAKAALPGELTAQLRTGRVRRRPQRRVKSAGPERGRIPAMVSIHDRPDDVAAREQPGHWEGDLIVGRHGRSHLVTLVERHSRYLIVLPIPDATSRTVVAALTPTFTALPATMRQSLTWDRGIEMTRHQRFTAGSGVPVYFCNPYSPWQRGTNENTNGLLRQYFPKKTDLRAEAPIPLVHAVAQINARPRERLGWKTAREVYETALVAMTG